MKTLRLLLCLMALTFVSCSDDELTQETQELIIIDEVELRGTFQLVNMWQNGIPQQLPNCDNPQVLTITESQFVLDLIVTDNCTFDEFNYNYTVDQNVITLTSGNRIIMLEVTGVDLNNLRYKHIFDTEEGGSYNGEIWEYDRTAN